MKRLYGKILHMLRNPQSKSHGHYRHKPLFVERLETRLNPGVLSISANAITTTQGAAFKGTVALLSDSDGDSAGNFQATINWGDGAGSAGTVAETPIGNFSISGTHVYKAIGQFQVRVQVSDVDGSSAPATGTITVTSAAGLNGVFVANAFTVLLGRPVDPASSIAFSDQLNSGLLTPSQFVAQVVGSQEFLANEVQEIYHELLNRAADPTGLNSSLTFLSQGGTVEQLEAVVLGSDEFFVQSGSSNTGFLKTVYLDEVNHTPDAAGQQGWLNALAGGESRTMVALAIITSAEAQTLEIQGLYKEFLQRAADPAGLSNSQAALQDGASETQITSAIVASPEFAQLSGGDANQFYVVRLFSDFLHRQAASDELATALSLLVSGGTRDQVVESIINSPETRVSQAQSYYQKYLHRQTDSAGIAYFTNGQTAGVPLETLESGILGSPEYFQVRASNDNDKFLDALFEDLLGRAVDPMARIAYDQALAAGVSRAQLSLVIFGTPEYQQDLVQSYYQRFLHRSADGAGLNASVSAIQAGDNGGNVIRALVESKEYFLQ